MYPAEVAVKVKMAESELAADAVEHIDRKGTMQLECERK